MLTRRELVGAGVALTVATPALAAKGTEDDIAILIVLRPTPVVGKTWVRIVTKARALPRGREKEGGSRLSSRRRGAQPASQSRRSNEPSPAGPGVNECTPTGRSCAGLLVWRAAEATVCSSRCAIRKGLRAASAVV